MIHLRSIGWISYTWTTEWYSHVVYYDYHPQPGFYGEGTVTELMRLLAEMP